MSGPDPLLPIVELTDIFRIDVQQADIVEAKMNCRAFIETSASRGTRVPRQPSIATLKQRIYYIWFEP